jgi:hypothetical protein
MVHAFVQSCNFYVLGIGLDLAFKAPKQAFARRLRPNAPTDTLVHRVDYFKDIVRKNFAFIAPPDRYVAAPFHRGVSQPDRSITLSPMASGIVAQVNNLIRFFLWGPPVRGFGEANGNISPFISPAQLQKCVYGSKNVVGNTRAPR